MESWLCVCHLYHFTSLSTSHLLPEVQVKIALTSLWCWGPGEMTEERGLACSGRQSSISGSSTGCRWACSRRWGPGEWQELAHWPLKCPSPPPRCTTTRSVAPSPTPAPGLSASSLRVSRRSIWPRRSPVEA